MFDYQPVINRFITENKHGIPQNKMSIKTFQLALRQLKQLSDKDSSQAVYSDQNRILKYKKIVATVCYVSLGKQAQLIPDIVNYRCCYSNKTERIDTYFITDVIDFKIF